MIKPGCGEPMVVMLGDKKLIDGRRCESESETVRILERLDVNKQSYHGNTMIA